MFVCLSVCLHFDVLNFHFTNCNDSSFDFDKLPYLKVGEPVRAVEKVLRLDHVDDRHQHARPGLPDALEQRLQPLGHTLAVCVQKD